MMAVSSQTTTERTEWRTIPRSLPWTFEGRLVARKTTIRHVTPATHRSSGTRLLASCCAVEGFWGDGLVAAAAAPGPTVVLGHFLLASITPAGGTYGSDFDVSPQSHHYRAG